MSALTVEAHPYADAWPMLREDELAELAADIVATGLRHPIIIHDGMILDGRNRHAACLLAGVTPVTEQFNGDDDDALAFVQSENNARRHQSKGSLAASWALSMLAANKRDGGRWAGTKGKPQKSEGINYEMLSRLGVIADHAPHLLVTVRDDGMSLNAAYTEAERARDAERLLLEEQERIEAEETDARARLEEIAPEYLERYESARQALIAWEDANRAEAARARREKAERERREMEERKARSDLYSGIAKAVQTIAGYGGYSDPLAVMDEYNPAELDPPQYVRVFERKSLDDALRFMQALIEWKDNQ